MVVASRKNVNSFATRRASHACVGVARLRIRISTLVDACKWGKNSCAACFVARRYMIYPI